MFINRSLIFSIISLLGISASAQVVKGRSEVFQFNKATGKLNYFKDQQGNRLPDFSYVGYHKGEKAIPDLPVQLTLRPEEGDDTNRLQKAIDELGKQKPDSNGHRGAILLKRGVYHVQGSLRINHNGIVLRGEGNGPDGTIIVATGYGDKKFKRTLIQVGNGKRIQVDKKSRQDITETFVPVGTQSFQVKSAEGFKVGDRIVVYRPSTKEWISHIGCDKLKPRWGNLKSSRWVKDGDRPGFYYVRGGYSGEQHVAKKADESWAEFEKRVPLSKDGKKLDFTRQWQPGTYDFYFERQITAITENRLSIDAPIVQALDKKFGGAAVYHYQAADRVYEVGIENLRLMSEFAEPVEGNPYGDPKQQTRSENHAWNAIKLNRNSENTWVRNVTANYFGWSMVSASGKQATVQDCVNLGHASVISGGRRYPFMIDGQKNLVQRCVTFAGRHEFVNQAQTQGPNVFVDCIGFNSKSSAGPHHRYAMGNLYDNVSTENIMESRFRGSSGTGHGWAGVQTVFYNCIARKFAVNAAPGTISWVIGSGKNADNRAAPASLYYQQVMDRLGQKALDRLASFEQQQSLGKYLWVKKRLEKEKVSYELP